MTLVKRMLTLKARSVGPKRTSGSVDYRFERAWVRVTVIFAARTGDFLRDDMEFSTRFRTCRAGSGATRSGNCLEMHAPREIGRRVHFIRECSGADQSFDFAAGCRKSIQCGAGSDADRRRVPGNRSRRSNAAMRKLKACRLWGVLGMGLSFGKKRGSARASTRLPDF